MNRRILIDANLTEGTRLTFLQATGYDDGSITITKTRPQDRGLITQHSTELCIIETQQDYEVFPALE